MCLHKLLFAGLLAVTGASGASTSSPAEPFRVGEPLPAFVLPTLEDGRRMSLDDLRGSRLVLHIFASW